MRQNLLVTLWSLLLISGCAETLVERQSVAIDIVPLTHTFSVELKDQRQALNEVEEYIESNWEVLADAEVELVVFSEKGQVVSKHVRQLLKQRGKDPEQLSETSKSESDQFDFQMVSVYYKTFTPVCRYYQLGYFGETDTGCYSENARWKAMTNPQKMVK
ncbi:hypothetical protein [Vibrio ulleungensis]|uniref:Lipoprotein n=1 Tax=Vibrio ulleungensis TaxID=2807619 RepID=A0ABS2HLL8_9VIBR|nr:hypothetical protein [Vibrio ulleungensis]MBM7038383.1 hypothetical protein [Vibrio ulleungensis]